MELQDFEPIVPVRERLTKKTAPIYIRFVSTAPTQSFVRFSIVLSKEIKSKYVVVMTSKKDLRIIIRECDESDPNAFKVTGNPGNYNVGITRNSLTRSLIDMCPCHSLSHSGKSIACVGGRYDDKSFVFDLANAHWCD